MKQRMRRLTGIIFGMLAILFFGAVSPVSADLTRISGPVYAYVNIPSGSPHDAFGANAGIVVGDKGVLVVDTLTSAKEARTFADDIRKITDKPVRWVVNTHSHLDHAFGNCVFKDMGATIISHPLGKERLVASGPKTIENPAAMGLAPDFWDGTRIVPADRTFDREMTVDLGNVSVRIIYPGAPTHSPDSVFVVVPEESTLFTGDILFTDFHPFLGEGDLAGWSAALDRIAGMNMKHIIPGHGPLSSANDLADMKAYLTLFDATARELCAETDDPKAVAAKMMEILPKRKDGAFIVGMNIMYRYAPKPAAGYSKKAE